MPCPGCREEKLKPADPSHILKPAEIAPLVPVAMTPIGHYAYKITWSDGHDSGIYTLENLRALPVRRLQGKAATVLIRPIAWRLPWNPTATPSRKFSMPGVKHVVAVASGKGGVGKSTVATNLGPGPAQPGRTRRAARRRHLWAEHSHR